MLLPLLVLERQDFMIDSGQAIPKHNSMMASNIGNFIGCVTPYSCAGNYREITMINQPPFLLRFYSLQTLRVPEEVRFVGFDRIIFDRIIEKGKFKQPHSKAWITYGFMFVALSRGSVVLDPNFAAPGDHLKLRLRILSEGVIIPVNERMIMKYLAILIIYGLSTIAFGAEKPQTDDFKRIVFIGNSITTHGPSKKVDWSGNWGMAASAQEKDYVHILTRALTKEGEAPPEALIRNASAFERGYMTIDLDTELKDVFEFGADLVIIALGENVAGFKSAEEGALFKKSLKSALIRIKEKSDPLIVIRSCFWASKEKDKILKEIASEVGGRFVDISALCTDESSFARSERDYSHAGVANHPGDKGMKAIADAILRALGVAE